MAAMIFFLNSPKSICLWGGLRRSPDQFPLSVLSLVPLAPFAQSVNVACLCINLPGLENFLSPPLSPMADPLVGRLGGPMEAIPLH